jgi:hypothetical protein
MDSLLPITGSATLLETLSPYVPDDFINESLRVPPQRGRRHQFCPAQLWRAHLLSLLTPAHSLNLVAQLLPEQRAWRRFASLANRQETPDVRMLHEFRAHAGAGGLRRINDELLRPLLPARRDAGWSVALIDATDLPAATSGFKKRRPAGIRRAARPPARAR